MLWFSLTTTLYIIPINHVDTLLHNLLRYSL